MPRWKAPAYLHGKKCLQRWGREKAKVAEMPSDQAGTCRTTVGGAPGPRSPPGQEPCLRCGWNVSAKLTVS